MQRIVDFGSGFWNIRSTFRLGGVVNIGTHTSLARRSDGSFVLLDSVELDPEILAEVKSLTDDGKAVKAILNLHPFHTVHTAAAARQFPSAKLYGTDRHVKREPSLNWETMRTDHPELHEAFGEDFIFTVPRGVHLIPANEMLHFASVVAIHRASKAMHVDDTLNWVEPLIGSKPGKLKFHPTLRFVLHSRAGAALEFREWVEELVTLCQDVEFVCTAHGPDAAPSRLNGDRLVQAVRAAYQETHPILDKHQAKHG